MTNELVSQINKKKIEAFTPAEIPIFQKLNEFNNTYATLRVQEEKTRMTVANFEKYIKDIETGKVPVHALSINIGPAVKHLNKGDKEEYLKMLNEQLQKAKNSYVTVEGQRIRRGDELGEARMGAFKLLVDVLKQQHDFTVKELSEKMSEKMSMELVRDIEDVNKNIDQALKEEKPKEEFTKEEKKEIDKSLEDVKEGRISELKTEKPKTIKPKRKRANKGKK